MPFWLKPPWTGVKFGHRVEWKNELLPMLHAVQTSMMKSKTKFNLDLAFFIALPFGTLFSPRLQPQLGRCVQNQIALNSVKA